MAVNNDLIFTATKCGIIEVWLKERVTKLASIRSGGGHMRITSLTSDANGEMLFADSSEGRIQDEADLIDRNDQQQFLASPDFLSNYGMPTLISNMQAAASEVLKGKQLKDLFNTTVLHETTVPILDMFMSMGSPHHWVDYLMPEDPNFYKLVAFSNSDSTDPSDSTKFDRLMVETRAVLSSSKSHMQGHEWISKFLLEVGLPC
ncbi:peroxisome biogenesis protein 3-2-like isoform X2 [Camellia sinensis]|uniref:peroxisome biogenesis protein 3-2-like isoform X2 n=1 Tax=Camellia sinensis TaxID=4442 RepID=UPI0010366847|nr:peroxisome biogenesis protein 3-2-like isoform X2 [Camellia sinensis]